MCILLAAMDDRFVHQCVLAGIGVSALSWSLVNCDSQ